MKINTSDLEDITNAFTELMSGKKQAIGTLEKLLSEVTHYKMSVNVAKPKRNTTMFVMAVTPDKSTVDKIAECMYSEKVMLNTIANLWAKASSWTLDVDGSIFSFLNAKEITALALHEIGHIMMTDAVPRRIQNIVQFSIATADSRMKGLFKNKLISKVLSLPLAAACLFQINPNKRELQEEIKADTNAFRLGYGPDLVCAISKIQEKMGRKPHTEVEDAVEYSKTLALNLASRKSALVNRQLNLLRNRMNNTQVADMFDEMNREFTNSMLMNSNMNMGMGMGMMCDASIDPIGQSFMEGAKRLDPIEQNQLDYIRIKISDMQTINDKMMIVSYINSKLELVAYYKSILVDPELLRKYNVPHTLSNLKSKEQELQTLKELAMNGKLTPFKPGFTVIYPDGYEG